VHTCSKFGSMAAILKGTYHTGSCDAACGPATASCVFDRLHWIAACPLICLRSMLAFQCASFHKESIIPLHGVFLCVHKQSPHVIPQVHGQASLHQHLELHAEVLQGRSSVPSSVFSITFVYAVEAINETLCATFPMVWLCNSRASTHS
jgi:hypothetical protein